MAIYYPTTANFIQKTLGAELLSGVTAAGTLNNVTSIQNKPGVMIIDRIDSNNNETPSKVEVITFAGTSGSTVTTLVRGLAGTTDQDHAVGAIVEFGPDILWAQGLIDSYITQHNEDGTHGAVTATSIDIGSTIAVTGVLDEDDMASDSAVKLATQQSIKAFVDGKIIDEDDMASDSATKVPTQQSVKAYVDNNLSSANTDGWTADTDTWVYVSASTFKIEGKDVTARFPKGTRLKFTQTTTKYAVVVDSAFSTDTTITIAVNTDYTIANAAISNNYYSYEANPAGYPVTFGVTVTEGLECKASLVGRELTIFGWSYLLQASGGSTTVEKTITHGFTYATVPIVVAQMVGLKYTSAPTTISDLTTSVSGDGQLVRWGLHAITTTTFKCHSTQTGTAGANAYRGFSWIVKGNI